MVSPPTMPSNSTIPLPQPAPLVAVPTTPPRTTIPLLQSAPVDVGVVLAQTPPGVASTLLNPAPTTAVLPQSTPIKTGVSTTFPFTTTQKFRIPSCTAMATEMKGYLVGPMPVQEFLDDFFPTGELPGLDAVPVFTHDCYRRTVNAKKETAAYKPFVSPFDETTLGFLTSLVLQGPDNSEIHSQPQNCQFFFYSRSQPPFGFSVQDQTGCFCLSQ